MAEKFDFGGYATKNDLLCSDGRTIRKDAFKDCDGLTVPLVWGHSHGSPSDVLGHAVLENRDDGVYAYGAFNDSDAGKTAKELVRHGDVKALSIYANRLVQKGGDVIHGIIREVSLCLAGANPGAEIIDLSFEHFDNDEIEFEANVFNGFNIESLQHSDKSELAHEDKKEEKTEEVKPMANEKEKTVQDVIDSMTEEQKNVMYYVVGQALEQNGSDDDEEEAEMKHNAFENDNEMNYISHAEVTMALKDVLEDAKKNRRSLRETLQEHMEDGGVLAHAVDTTGMDIPTMTNAEYGNSVGYGINGIDFLYPEARALSDQPEFIKRDTSWVDEIWNGVKRTPFARVKTIFADLTEDSARAKGYMKGNMKKDQFFSLMKRVTTPQTIYKRQKIDRDDVIDITDFGIVAWLKSEMRGQWNEEAARAMLIGDGRLSSDNDKIFEDHIRPIVSDAPLFTIQATVTNGGTPETTAKNMMKAAIRARKDYKGSGNPIMFTTEDWLTSMLLIEDQIGHYIYKSEAELATALRVRKIVTVPVMENFKLENGNELMAIIVNLKDYNVGTDRGGEINLFDDFDIDYNQYKYLIEARCSGALVMPYSAIVLSMPASNNSGDDEENP